jgi:very-short-patch-repair endonuclease
LVRTDLEFSISKFKGELPGVTLHRVKTLDHEEDCRDYKGIRITDGARTVIDLATRMKEEDAAILVEEAWRKRVAAPQWVEKKLKAMKPRPRGGKMLLEILADCLTRRSALESALEVRVWRLLKKNGFTGMVANQPFSDDYGQPGRIDIAFPKHSLAIECDGWESHGTREAFDNDRKRTQRLVALGWRVLPITWKHLNEEPMKVVERVRAALEYRVSRRAR